MQTKLSARNSALNDRKRPAVVLIHGFAENNQIWEQQQAYLSEQFYLIVPDLPGSGQTPLTESLSIESMADFIHATLLEGGIEKAVIIGHSMGGYVALALAEKYPAMVKGLGLFHSTAAADSEEKKEGRLKSIGIIEQYGGDAFIKQALPNMFSPVYKKQHPEKVDAYVEAGSQCAQASLIAWYHAMINRPDRTSVLLSLKAPVLFVIGKDDTAVPLKGVLPQVSMPDTSSIHILADTGHMGMWELPEASSHLLQEFILFCQ
ncbi:Pimeloyl-ACP methyl ester carboxylesterase [Chitinophaga sp. CF118]|uniref:alpha/beta fold hydrolase n=1 Tax=Chitinophaga sp. CF118 TaxID=1884367 RepID=UPI0008E69D25|nr:alpha/beta hydrolase [Chitinophaga sp. CF118]SFD12197.1 Pimeloyl-ACP methyl ester carboxylesterase [Chitinophaga sp. CF118]